MVSMGTRWKVGDGCSNDIRRDKWIKKPPVCFLLLFGSQQPTVLKVSSLINTQERTWKSDMVRELFNQEDASQILCIPLSTILIPNGLIWMDSIKGQFTVKSAYFVACKMLNREQILRVDRLFLWRILWSAKVVPKICYFMWRLVQGIIPRLHP